MKIGNFLPVDGFKVRLKRETGPWALVSSPFVHIQIASTRQTIHLQRIIYGTKQDTLADHIHIWKKTENKKTQPCKHKANNG